MQRVTATFGQNRRTAGETCALLLAFPGRRTSEPAAVRSDAGPDRVAAGTDGIAEVGPVRIGIGRPRLQLREESCCKSGTTSGNLCCLGADRRAV